MDTQQVSAATRGTPRACGDTCPAVDASKATCKEHVLRSISLVSEAMVNKGSNVDLETYQLFSVTLCTKSLA